MMISSIHLPKPKRRSSSSLQESAMFVPSSSDGYDSDSSDVTEITSNTGNLSGALSVTGGNSSALHTSSRGRPLCRSTTTCTNATNHSKKSVGSNDGTLTTRWSTGDAIKPAKRGIQVLKKPSCCDRRHSGSTSSTTSDGSSISSSGYRDFDGDDKPQEEQQQKKKDMTTIIADENHHNVETSNNINNTIKGTKEHQEVEQADAEEDQDCCSYDLKSKPGYINVQEEDADVDDNEEDNFELLLDGSGDHHNNHSYSSPCHQSHTHHSASGGCGNTACSSGSGGGGSSSAPSFFLTEERVRVHMKDYYEDFDSIFRHGKSSEAIWDSFFKQYYTEDILWVRSSSNTLKGPELAHHFANDIEGIRMQLVCIDNIQILGGMSAVVVFTADQEFLYRGHPVSDRTVLTMVLHVDDSLGRGREKIRIAHEHRCVGKPIPKNTRWGS